ncbi:LOW QUALITY PROTEIN: prostaglandin E receptor 1c (subtype EP1) [Polymixia lowei]
MSLLVLCTLVRSSGFVMSCFTMTFGAFSNLTALGILAKSHIRFRRQAKAPFLLLLVDLRGHVIPGAFAVYLRTGRSQKHKATARATEPAEAFCQIFGASVVFFGLCPLLLGRAMAVARCAGITRPLLPAAAITVTRVRLVVLLVSSLAVLPLLDIGTYTSQFPGTRRFLPTRGPRSAADTDLALASSRLGLTALVLSLLCNILSGLTLLQARVSSESLKPKSAARRNRHTCSISSSSTSSEMMAQLAVVTVISCVCWSLFLVVYMPDNYYYYNRVGKQ